ncbi:MAG: cell division protein FtsX [Candidatus Binatia bacterium]
MTPRRPRPFYFLRRALRNLRGAPLPALLSAATIAIAILLFGLFLLSGQNLYRLLVGWAGEGEPLTVYAARDLDAADLDRLEKRIRELPEVGRVQRILPGEALADLGRMLGDDAELLAGVEPREVIGPILSVALRERGAGSQEVLGLARVLRRLDGVEDVESATVWLDRLSRIVRISLWFAAGWGVVLGLGALLVISNTARLAALTRREEIEVLRLVGASDGFIVLPFFWEGALQGLAGSVLGVGLLAAALALVRVSLAGDPLFSPLLPELRFLDPATTAGLFAAGPVLGGLGSIGSAMRFLRGVAL